MRTNKKIKLANKTIVARSSGDFFVPKPGVLQLADKTVLHGLIPKWFDREISGEAVFNTGMTGYVETLTDPSYAHQIVIFTFPLIGNYGVHESNWESQKIHASGVVVANLVDDWSHPRSNISFASWLKSQNVPFITGIDTRWLTRHLRSKGTMAGAIVPNPVKLHPKVGPTPHVGIAKPVSYNPNSKTKIILIDCGAKENIIRSLVARNLHVRRVPYDYDFLNEDYDGVVLSNGPGDPTDYQPTIDNVARCLKGSKPVFGICLGAQLMSLAVGAKTYKLKYGHRGHNQPCLDETDSKCYITSQNHGYAVDEKTLPQGWRVMFRNLNDGSVEGVYHQSKPFFSVQFHPEAAPGPTDSAYLFDKFVGLL